MDLELRHLRLVATVAAYGSLTAAADQVHLTQSALSHQLRDIEDRLGTPLFLRRNRKMIPTPAGQRVLESARSILSEIERTEADVRSLANDRQGLLRVATECYTCYHWLPDALQEFGRSCPSVDVRIEVEATGRPLTALLDGTLDLAIMTSPVRDRRLATTPLFRDELLVLAPKDHALARRSYVRPADLAGETIYTYSPKEESYVFKKLLTPAGIDPQVRQVRLTEVMLEMVRARMGLAILARWVVQPYLESRAIVGLRLTERGFYRQWHAVVPRTLAGTDYVAEFLRLVASRAPVGRGDVTTRPVLRPVRATG
jgi:LysR family transcriptional regulator, regulator for metE and metH